ncbi:hypothetical protein SCMU_28930 [Sinomonas cyclohexanicum]|uniref:Choice-of-anchor G family protein n=1 Tax=Sinomonas cyclohexanicum TaxID=322009 RepID=A0ABN6FK37_SINCY|nr:choice-of-anchor G family protein [Corynebacterium cyclohexanicum]BCT77051.1 hypothetical protein SCMU_28930 [Corynebacterium cyclohexanicum]
MTSTDAPTPVSTGSSAAGRIARRTVLGGAAWAAPTILLAQSASAAAASCRDVYKNQAMGQLLAGMLGGYNLAQITPAHASVDAASGPNIATDGNTLNVNALGIQLPLLPAGNTISSVLALVVNQNLGTLNQFAQANTNGEAIGASGAVSNASGGINLTNPSPSSPEFGTLHLKSILQQITGNSNVTNLVAQVTDIGLQIGAVVGRASWVGCPAPQTLREYLIAYLRLVVKSAVIGNLATGIQGVLNTTASASAVVTGINNILNPVLAVISGANKLSTTVTLTLDTTVLTPLPTDVTAPLRIDINGATATLDLTTLLGGAYQGGVSNKLNGRSPNTPLYSTGEINALDPVKVINQWVDSFNAVLDQVIQVKITTLAQTNGGQTKATIAISGTLGEVSNGTASVTVTPDVGGVIATAVKPLLPAIGTVLKNAIVGALRPSNGTLATVFNGLDSLLINVFAVLRDVLLITVDREWDLDVPTNATTDVAQSIGYPSWTTPAFNKEYFVSALEVSLLPGVAAPAGLLDIKLATGAVGPKSVA